LKDILILAEHRMGELRDITFEMLFKGRELAEKMDSKVTVILLGSDINNLALKLAEQANKVFVIDDKKLMTFNSDLYQRVLSHLIKENNPLLTLIGHTAYGVDLAPSLAVELDIPLASDCIDLKFEEGKCIVNRQMYNGKVNVEASLRKSKNYIVTIRPGVFKAENAKHQKGLIVNIPTVLKDEITRKKFVGYVKPPESEVDITKANILVSVGRGIKDENNLQIVKELAKALGAEVTCSRPIVDKGWLPKDRQVGISGKIVKPKLYFALGISGAFQHILGMKESELIIAVNKDIKAPIFRVADYGIVEDIQKIVTTLTKKIYEASLKK
jgi:electron transfer flavoprotein alpha subunit